jgi:nitroreductase
MFFELIRKRRSIRRFTNQAVEKEKIDSFDGSSVAIAFLKGYSALAICGGGSAGSAGKTGPGKTPWVIVFTKCATGYCCVRQMRQPADVWVEDAAIASTFIHLAARDLDLGSCWIQIRKRDHSTEKTAEARVKDLVNMHIPDTMCMVQSIIAIGYPDEIKPGHAQRQSLAYDKVFFNQFGKTSL